MRLWLMIILLPCVIAACAFRGGVNTTTTEVSGWAGREVDELIEAIGPYATSSIRRDSRTYSWHGVGYCRVTAGTSPDGKIVKVETTGTSEGCSGYLEKMGAK